MKYVLVSLICIWLVDRGYGLYANTVFQRVRIRLGGLGHGYMQGLFAGTREANEDKMRNVAIIAHVDHGKTTLVDSMIRQSGAFRSNQEIASMDNNDQERERGITILAKNAAILYKGVKINLVDTPGHADFGGEVERIMNMVDGVLLVVDSVDGPKPQTRFVLKKALEKGLKAVVVINKIDRPQARPSHVVDKVFDLFAELNATDAQMDFPVVYSSGLKGVAGSLPEELTTDLKPLFDEILRLPEYSGDASAPLQLLIANIDVDGFRGKMGIGRVMRGRIQTNMDVVYGKPDQPLKKGKISDLCIFDNIGQSKVTQVDPGEIAVVMGLADVSIGDTVMSLENPCPLPAIYVDEPTVRITIAVNKSPFSGRDGKLLQSRVIRDRLQKELEKNVALRVYDTENSDTFEVCGRGQLHLTVLIENMRREGFELMIGPPTVIDKVINGVEHEPFEVVDVTAPTEYSSSIVDMMNRRKGELQSMGPTEGSEGFTQHKFIAPTRGLIGLRSALMTCSKGTAIMDTSFLKYMPKVGKFSQRDKGSLVACEAGVSNPYGIESAQERGKLFIGPKTEVYPGMIIGVHQRPGDLQINICKLKKLTNMRAASADDYVKLAPPLELNLDKAVEYIQEDELVEVTPTQVRMLKNPDSKNYKR